MGLFFGFGKVGSCTAIGAVMLNPDREQQISNDELQAA